MTPIPDDQWIDHKPGDPMPVGGETLVDVRFRLGIGAQFETAEDLCWDEVGQMDIISYRPSYGPAGNMVAEPTEPAAGEREALAEFLCAELFRADTPDPVNGATWPEHDNDTGQRGDNGGYVRLQPKDVVAGCREASGRILAFLNRRALTQTDVNEDKS